MQGGFNQAKAALILIAIFTAVLFHTGRVSASSPDNESPDPEPLAVEDAYSVEQNQDLSVVPPGVLANDIIVGQSSVFAVLVDPVSYGVLELASDGSFQYAPQLNFVGLDSFTYQVHADRKESNTARVEISVLDSQAPTLDWVSPVPSGERFDVRNEVVRLEVNAQDNFSVSRVVFYRWDAIIEDFVDISSVETAPYQFDMDCSGLNPEWNQIFGRAFDEAGNASERNWIWLYKLDPISVIFLPAVSR